MEGTYKGTVEIIGPEGIFGWVLDERARELASNVQLSLGNVVLAELQTADGRTDVDAEYACRTRSGFVWKPAADPHALSFLHSLPADETLGLRAAVIVADKLIDLDNWFGLPLSRSARGWLQTFGMPSSRESTDGLGSPLIRRLSLAGKSGAPPVCALSFSEIFFDPLTYYEAYPGCQAGVGGALRDYLEGGWRESRNGGSGFDVKAYLRQNPDVEAEGLLEPMTHYLRYGQHEGRRPFMHAVSQCAPSQRFVRLLSIVQSGVDDGHASSDLAVVRWWIDFAASRKAAAEQNPGWLSGRRLAPEQRLSGRASDQTASSQALCDAFAAGTAFIGDTYLRDKADVPAPPVSDLTLALRAKVERQRRRVPPPSEEGVAVLTPFCRHVDYFRECAASVALCFGVARANSPQQKLEWLIANDDPLIGNAEIENMIPAQIRPLCRIIKTGAVGTTAATNRLISKVKQGWLFFLDCDDIIMPDAIAVVDHYARRISSAYISSGIIDIDEQSRVIRYRSHTVSPLEAPKSGMSAGHLKAIHRSLFKQYGLLSKVHDLCQDYEFMLRVLDREHICLIPEYLYGYRWHAQTQSVAKANLQMRRARAARSAYSLSGRTPVGQAQDPVRTSGVAIRTIGERPKSLAEAILSTRSFVSGQVTPVVIVHGDRERFKFVTAILNEHFDAGSVHIIGAAAPDKEIGYPLNVGMRFIFEDLGLDAASILDDDDIMLPGAFQMLAAASRSQPQVWLGRTLCRQLSGQLVEMYPLRAAASLVYENFVPTNGYLVTRPAYERVLAAHGEYCPEDLHYYDDWMVLLRLLSAGAAFRYWNEFVGEFRLGSDGNTAQRNRPMEFSRCDTLLKRMASSVKWNCREAMKNTLDAFNEEFARELSADSVQKLVSQLA